MIKYRHSAAALSLVVLTLAPVFGSRLTAQSAGGSISTRDGQSRASVLEREYPDFYDLLFRIERAHGLLYAGLMEEGETVRANGDGLPTFEFEFDMLDRLSRLTGEEGRAEHVADEAAAGFAVLGDEAAQTIAWGNEFYRDVMGVLADPAVTVFADRKAALVEAVERYRSRPELALPSQPKDMDILFEHGYALQFRGGYADLDGLIWAGYWLKLAASEPLTDLREKEPRQEGIDTVTNRYHLKLSYGQPPEFFPSELPLAPAISPGLIFLSPEASAILDNLSFMQEVFVDIMAAPEVPDVQAALDAALSAFLDPEYRISTRGDWESMALQHGIFFQGGYPLAVMTQSERNADGHAAHLAAGGAPVLDPRMPG